MSKCKDCDLKRGIARAFDLHWIDETDCPFTACAKDKGEPVRLSNLKKCRSWIIDEREEYLAASVCDDREEAENNLACFDLMLELIDTELNGKKKGENHETDRLG